MCVLFFACYTYPPYEWCNCESIQNSLWDHCLQQLRTLISTALLTQHNRLIKIRVQGWLKEIHNIKVWCAGNNTCLQLIEWYTSVNITPPLCVWCPFLVMFHSFHAWNIGKWLFKAQFNRIRTFNIIYFG